MAFHFSPKIVTDGLILYIDGANTKSYTNPNSSIFDLSTNKVGSLINGVTFSSLSGGEFTFDGLDDKIGFGTEISSLNLTYPFSIDTWINVDPTGNTTTFRGIFTTSTTPTLTQYYGVWLQLGSAYNGSGNYKIGVGVGNGLNPGFSGRRSYSSDNEVIIGGTWCHVVATIDSGPTFKLYVNGVEVSGTLSGTGGALVWGSGTVTELGRQSGGYDYFFKGKISNLKFYNTLLSPNQVLQNFRATKSRFGL